MREIDPATTTRAWAFDHWMKAPMPMVTFFRTWRIDRAIKYARKNNLRLNMLLCWCIGMGAREMDEFYILPVGDKLFQYDKLAVNTIVLNDKGEVSSCDIPFSGDLAKFNVDYLDLVPHAAQSCANHDLDDYMVIGTSNIAKYEIDGAVGMYSGIFNNPFLIWGKYAKKLLGTFLKVSFQFHHTQMDGMHAAKFLQNVQNVISDLEC